MNPRGRSSFARKPITKAQHRVALQSMLLMRRTLEDIDVERLVRCYGLSAAETTAMVEGERLRRASREATR